MKSFILIICLLLNISVAISGTIDPNVPDEKYLSYAKKFECVVKITGTFSDSDAIVKPFVASAVVIKPHWILTAAHVVNQYKTAYITDNEDQKHSISYIVIHKDFDANAMGFNDIALCYVEDVIDVNFYPEIYDGDDEVGKICCFAGFGITGNFRTGVNKESKEMKKRAGLNTIDRIENHLLICSASLASSKDNTELEYLLASGDSGGGLFIEKKLAGINSIVISEGGSDNKADSDYGDESGHTRVSIYKMWIEENIKSK